MKLNCEIDLKDSKILLEKIFLKIRMFAQSVA